MRNTTTEAEAPAVRDLSDVQAVTTEVILTVNQHYQCRTEQNHLHTVFFTGLIEFTCIFLD